MLQIKNRIIEYTKNNFRKDDENRPFYSFNYINFYDYEKIMNSFEEVKHYLHDIIKEGFAIISLSDLPLMDINKNIYIWKPSNHEYYISDLKNIYGNICFGVVKYKRTLTKKLHFKNQSYDKCYCIGFLIEGKIYEVIKLIDEKELDELLESYTVYYRQDSYSKKYIKLNIFKFMQLYEEYFKFYDDKSYCIKEIISVIKEEKEEEIEELEELERKVKKKEEKIKKFEEKIKNFKKDI